MNSMSKQVEPTSLAPTSAAAMGLDSDPYRDEDGEPLMDPDGDGEDSLIRGGGRAEDGEPLMDLDDDGEDSPVSCGGFVDDNEDEWEADAEAEAQGYDPVKVCSSKSPAFDPDKVGDAKPRKRLMKKGDDWIDDVPDERR